MRQDEYKRSKSGLTLVELILVLALMGTLTAALVPVLRSVNAGWKAGERTLEVSQNARVAVDFAMRALRQSRRVTAVSGPGETPGFIEFVAADNRLQRFDFDSETGMLRLGPPASQSNLAGPVHSLAFTCYDSGNRQMPAPVNLSQVRAVAVDVTVLDAENHVPDLPMTMKALVRRDAGLVINEIMYNPQESPDRKHEWIEIYNLGEAVDLSGWSIASRTNPLHPDTLLPDEKYGSGITVLQPNGYAVVACNQSQIYRELLDNPGFETESGDLWKDTGGWSRQMSADVKDGLRRLERSGPGGIYQQCSVPNDGYVTFVCWEKSPFATHGSRLVLTVRTPSNKVLETIYDGPMHGNWTCHYADLTAYAGTTLRVHIETVGHGTYCFDDVSLNWSRVSTDALRFVLDDNSLTQVFKNDWDTVNLFHGDAVLDSVPYFDTWGGDGNGESLERIDPNGASDDQGNWTSGPEYGTPGRSNVDVE
jgi:type II secretory pathway pseudopilin PulG